MDSEFRADFKKNIVNFFLTFRKEFAIPKETTVHRIKEATFDKISILVRKDFADLIEKHASGCITFEKKDEMSNDSDVFIKSEGVKAIYDIFQMFNSFIAELERSKSERIINGKSTIQKACKEKGIQAAFDRNIYYQSGSYYLIIRHNGKNLSISDPDPEGVNGKLSSFIETLK